ncbi:hypothetical protein [Nioella sp.]|uniref:hypothetical protein n=1 Tax=Nioella sp. TaxID=1912091 RepID=UPI003B51EEF6
MSETDRNQPDAEVQAMLRAEILSLRTELAQRDAEILALLRQSDETVVTEAPRQPPTGLSRGWLRTRLARLRHRLMLRHQASALARSRYFDANWYAARYPECDGPDKAATHYLLRGAFAGHDPGPDFHTKAYYSANPDVAEAGWPALAHYVLHGQAEGRRRGPAAGG